MSNKIKNIMVCCGSGLGSSFMIQMNVEKALKEMGVEGVNVDHCDLGSAKGTNSDLFIGTRDIASELVEIGKPVISLVNMLDKEDLKNKLEEELKKADMI